MFEIRVRLFANLKEAVGRPTLTLVFDHPPTPYEIIKDLISKAPGLEKYLLKHGEFNDRYRILKDSEEIPRDKFTEPIHSKEISILPPVSGG
ncbi:MAG: MoaD/ThiS family protein [Candidatus Verstraetearchaeota archaeon]|jgi:molybdopterin converting factor small subunit|nr:MoaD/ThiS family protein [Candidatus Verstraetearchaeota archaeon]